jgi:hypothetical protein
MAADTSIWVASIASAGVILSSAIQGSLTRSSTKRADAARDDQREQDRVRREEDRANERLIREEEHAAALQRQKAEAEATAEADRRATEHETKARLDALAAEFVGQAQKCLLFLRRTWRAHDGVTLGDVDWDVLATLLGNVTAAFESEDREWARKAVNCLMEATFVTEGVQQLDLAESYLGNFYR